MKVKQPRKPWTDKDTAFLAALMEVGVLGGGKKLTNKHLGILLGRTEAAIESRKRDIRNGRYSVDKLMKDTVLEVNPTYGSWSFQHERHIAEYQEKRNKKKELQEIEAKVSEVCDTCPTVKDIKRVTPEMQLPPAPIPPTPTQEELEIEAASPVDEHAPMPTENCGELKNEHIAMPDVDYDDEIKKSNTYAIIGLGLLVLLVYGIYKLLS